MKQRIGLKIVLGLCIMYTGWCVAAQPLVPNWKPDYGAAYLCIGTSAVGFKKIGSTWRMVRFSLKEGLDTNIQKEFLIKPHKWSKFSCNAEGRCYITQYKTLIVRAFGAPSWMPNMFHLTNWNSYRTLFFTGEFGTSNLRFNTFTGKFMSWSTFGYWTANISDDPWMEIGTCQKIS